MTGRKGRKDNRTTKEKKEGVKERKENWSLEKGIEKR